MCKYGYVHACQNLEGYLGCSVAAKSKRKSCSTIKVNRIIVVRAWRDWSLLPSAYAIINLLVFKQPQCSCLCVVAMIMHT